MSVALSSFARPQGFPASLRSVPIKIKGDRRKQFVSWPWLPTAHLWSLITVSEVVSIPSHTCDFTGCCADASVRTHRTHSVCILTTAPCKWEPYFLLVSWIVWVPGVRSYSAVLQDGTVKPHSGILLPCSGGREDRETAGAH